MSFEHQARPLTRYAMQTIATRHRRPRTVLRFVERGAADAFHLAVEAPTRVAGEPNARDARAARAFARLHHRRQFAAQPGRDRELVVTRAVAALLSGARARRLGALEDDLGRLGAIPQIIRDDATGGGHAQLVALARPARIRGAIRGRNRSPATAATAAIRARVFRGRRRFGAPGEILDRIETATSAARATCERHEQRGSAKCAHVRALRVPRGSTRSQSHRATMRA